MIEKIEQNALGHFKYLPEAVGFNVRAERSLTIINCGLGSSMFNIVYGGLDDRDASEKIEMVIEEFKGQPFAWWVPSSVKSDLLSEKLLECGFVVETTEYAMLCDLDRFDNASRKSDVLIEQVQNATQLDDFIKVLEPYDDTVRQFYERLTTSMLQGQERLFVAYEGEMPAVIGILFIYGDSAGIFSLLTNEDKRGLGYGAQMMDYLMNFAKGYGVKYVTLSASSDSGSRIYERIGFKNFGEFQCFEWNGKSGEF